MNNSSSNDDIIQQLAEMAEQMQVIVDKYDENPELYTELSIVRYDTVKLVSMLFYFNPRQAIIETELENLIQTRKRVKSSFIAKFVKEIPGRGNVSAAEHMSRGHLKEYDKKIAQYRTAAGYAKALLFSVQRLVDQLNENIRSIGREMRLTRDA